MIEISGKRKLENTGSPSLLQQDEFCLFNNRLPDDMIYKIFSFVFDPKISLVNRRFKRINNHQISLVFAKTLEKLQKDQAIFPFIPSLRLLHEPPHRLSEAELERSHSGLYKEITKDLDPHILEGIKKKYPTITSSFYEAVLIELKNASLIKIYSKIRLRLRFPKLKHAESIKQFLRDPDNLQSIQRVSAIRLDELRLTVLPDEISLFSGLQHLYLKKCNLKGLSHTCLSALVELKVLDLENNEISSFEGLPDLKKLSAIHLKNNKITSFKGLPVLKSLEIIDLENNEIASFKGLPSLPKLETCWLKKNQLSSFESFPRLISLQYMNLNDNEITSFEGFLSLSRLRILELNKNKITSFKGFPSLEALECLELDNNRIISFQDLLPLQNLKILKLKKNKIKSFANSPNLQNLNYLMLDGNSIKSLQEFPILPELTNLYLRKNKLANHDFDCLSNSPKLEHVGYDN